MKAYEKVSIIVPVYNTEQYLPACIESILNQTHTNLELFLVDDGSTDNSLEICWSYRDRDDRVIVLTKENGGQGSARNMALDRITGDYVVFVDSDDRIEPTLLSEVGSKLQSDMQIAVFGYTAVRGAETVCVKCCDADMILSNKELMNAYVATDRIRTILWNKMYRATLFTSVRFPHIRANEDTYILHEVLGQCTKCVCIPDCYYIQNVRPNSTEQKAFTEKNLVLLDCARRLIDYYAINYPELMSLVAYREVNEAVALQRRIMLTGVYWKNRKIYRELSCRIQEAYSRIHREIPGAEGITEQAKEAIFHPIRFKVKNWLRGIKRKLLIHSI